MLFNVYVRFFLNTADKNVSSLFADEYDNVHNNSALLNVNDKRFVEDIICMLIFQSLPVFVIRVRYVEGCIN